MSVSFTLSCWTPEHRMNKVHTVQLEGYKKFDFMLLCAHAAPSGECSYYLDATQYHHARIMQDFTVFFFELVNDTFSGTHIFFHTVHVLVLYTILTATWSIDTYIWK